jgi:hypothetical protein
LPDLKRKQLFVVVVVNDKDGDDDNDDIHIDNGRKMSLQQLINNNTKIHDQAM